jgi:signal peptide peptidase SppA
MQPDRIYEPALSFALDHPWAITPDMLHFLAGFFGRRLAGLRASDEEISAALVKRKNLPQPTGGAVGVLPVYGVIAPRANLLSEMSGGTSFEALTSQLREMVANKSISTIVLDVDSPGGSVAGATEFAREVMKARTKKPVIAQAQYTMASAAYWISAAATEIIASPSALVGSVGVYTMHNDLSAALEQLGIKRKYIYAGKHKVDGMDNAPLSAETEARIQAKVDAAYANFIGDISKGRGTPLADVRSGYGEGDVVTADDALRLGMIDGIATLEETIARAVQASPASAQQAALDTAQEPIAATAQDRAARHDDAQRIALALLSL